MLTVQDFGELVTCPFNKSHTVTKAKLQFHIIRCKRTHVETNKVACPFNNTHLIDSPELEYHVKVCPDRKELDKFIHSLGDDSCPAVSLLQPRRQSVPSDSEENWDNCQTSVSVLDTIKASASEKPLLRSVPGTTKSQRKNFRKQERRRHAQYMESNGKKPVAEHVSSSSIHHNEPKPAARIEPELQLLEDYSHIDSTFSSMRGLGRGKPKKSDGMNKLVKEVNVLKIQAPEESYRFPVQAKEKDSAVVKNDFSKMSKPNLFPDNDAGFCTLPIPGLGRGKKRNP